ncbi:MULTISPECIES: hypothetical protein [unclassified Ensifer]|uniref:hypothetical protein n=1 Tax=unclassified Ensifer TaxID=2633371 RepID=UPI0008135A29|nr:MULTISPECIES: hypothetical protein [unclassified Ensifer]OCP17032.1 hypothetical protein BC360_12405 [Ensifer sp. LC163]OCP24139.1 hypothetical protein BC363_23170 [Ensifer sp. LC384]OCP25628.1 hypothetical protein BC361_17525 [Ensifer sp. LC54]
MINIAALRPSDITTLDHRLSDQSFAQDFLAALAKFLTEVGPDGGADSDRIFMAAVQLTQAKAWNHFDATALRKALSSVPQDAMVIFCDGLPTTLASRLLP